MIIIKHLPYAGHYEELFSQTYILAFVFVSFTHQNNPVTSAPLPTHFMHEETEAGGSDFPEAPQPEGVGVMEAQLLGQQSLSLGSPHPSHPSQECPCGLFPLPRSRKGHLGAGKSQPKGQRPVLPRA